MSPLPVIEQLDVLRDLAASLLTGLVAPVMHQLILQCPSGTLHRRIVIAVALPTHGRGHAELSQPLLIVLRTILGPTVGVVDQAWAWTLHPHRFPEGIVHQVRRHPSTHGMPDHLTGEQILNAGEIQSAFCGRHVRDVGHPGLVWSCRNTRVGHDMLRHRQDMIRRGGRGELPNWCAAQPQLRAQPLDAPDPNGEPVGAQFGLEALRAVRLTGPHMGSLDCH